MADMSSRSTPATCTPLASFPDDGCAVVFGASGAIGGALLAALRKDPTFGTVHGFSRHSDPGVDVTDERSIAGLANHLSNMAAPVRSNMAAPVRLILNATGFLHGEGLAPEKSWRHIDAAHMAHAFAVNATGPALLMKHLLPLLPRQGKAVFATLSAKVGSIGDNRIGGWYSYRASKAALNQIVHTAAIELQWRKPSAICVALHPGTVDSPLSGPFGKKGLDVVAPPAAAARLLAVVDGLKPEDSGGFFDYAGSALPW
ncbi:MAG: SDR family NAD(P)-dependent oxidoreductase [Acetobacterales bacterium]